MLEVFGRDIDLPCSTFGCGHPNADSYKDLTPKQIYKKHENDKKYAERVMEIEQATFIPLVVVGLQQR